jgi:hypothetical protein
MKPKLGVGLLVGVSAHRAWMEEQGERENDRTFNRTCVSSVAVFRGGGGKEGGRRSRLRGKRGG